MTPHCVWVWWIKGCSSCKYGYFASEGCEGTDDTVCSPCTACTELEYEVEECSAGVDTVCESCLECEWLSEQMEVGCRGVPVWWFWDNCWTTEDGVVVKRSLVDLEDLRIDNREGRHHWVWDKAIPEVYGYTQEDFTEDLG